VKWRNIFSTWFNTSCGIRQGSVLSPYLLAIYIDSLVSKVQSCGHGCYVRYTCVSILLYADDILLLAPSVSSLQLLLDVCEKELERIDMNINVKNRLVCVLAQDLVFTAVVLLLAMAENNR